LAANLLQSIVNDAAQASSLKHLLGDSCGRDYPIVQYADDTLLIMPTEETQLFHLQFLLLDFARSTGLKVNFSKSSIVPINVDDTKTASLAEVFGCQVGQMPFTFLGLPLGMTRPLVQDYLPLVCTVERRMIGITPFLSYAGRLVLVNSLLSAIPTFYLCTLKVPITVLDQIDSCRKHCLRDRGDIHKKGGCLVAWKKACLAKKDGGLGIIDLITHNTSLLLKFLHKFYNHDSTPWVRLTWDHLYASDKVLHSRQYIGSFWWRDVMLVVEHFFKIAACRVHNGKSVCLWTDQWDLGGLQCFYPHLFSFAKDRHVSIAKFLQQDVLARFYTPLSIIAAKQLAELSFRLSRFHMNPKEHDQWTFIWGSYVFTDHKAYVQLKGQSGASHVFEWLWKSCSRGRHKFTFWLLLLDRLSTRNILRQKRRVLDDYCCPMCSRSVEETVDHLFFTCAFATWFWRLLHISWDMDSDASGSGS
jgi:hypothetical protein